ncbi:hypothetical protein ACFE04_013241 [Oxalis oulophora]
MDWFSWLSKTKLHPSLTYEYSLAFSRNELQEEDIVYLDHDFLQSMGISIAKHRLEILKLARKEKGPAILLPQPLSRVLVAIKKTKKCLANHVKTLVSSNPSSALVVVSKDKPSYCQRFRNAIMKRNKRFVMGNDKSHNGRLLLTNASSMSAVVPTTNTNTRLKRFSGPLAYDWSCKEEDDKKPDYVEDIDDDYWSTGFEEIRWDTMFQGLKPT